MGGYYHEMFLSRQAVLSALNQKKDKTSGQGDLKIRDPSQALLVASPSNQPSWRMEHRNTGMQPVSTKTSSCSLVTSKLSHDQLT
jgi:hypothetical protein